MAQTILDEFNKLNNPEVPEAAYKIRIPGSIFSKDGLRIYILFNEFFKPIGILEVIVPSRIGVKKNAQDSVTNGSTITRFIPNKIESTLIITDNVHHSQVTVDAPDVIMGMLVGLGVNVTDDNRPKVVMRTTVHNGDTSFSGYEFGIPGTQYLIA